MSVAGLFRPTSFIVYKGKYYEKASTHSFDCCHLHALLYLGPLPWPKAIPQMFRSLAQALSRVRVTIVQATVAGPGWVVIHADNGGAPGPVIGHAPLVEGVNTNVAVTIDTDAVTPILHAMLHVDAGTVGIWEFPGPDVPVKIGDAIVMARFSDAPVVSEVEEVAAPVTMPKTGAAPSTPLIFAVSATVLLVLGASVVVSRRRHA